MFCNNCGNQIPDGTKFCNHCGSSQEAPQQATPVANTPAPTPQPKKNNTLIIAIIAIIAVVCLVVALFVIAPSSKDDDKDNKTSQSQKADEKDDENDSDSDDADEDSGDSDDGKLEAIKGDVTDGKVFVQDLGEYGKVTVSVGYNKTSGVICQVTASIKITDLNENYETLKSNMEAMANSVNDANDKNAEASFAVLSDNTSFIVAFSKLNAADRAERVVLAEEVLDFVANEDDSAFYIDDITTLLVDTYGYTIQE